MNTPKTDAGAKTQSVRLDGDIQNDAFHAALKLAGQEQKVVPISTVLRMWIKAARDIYCAKTREEAFAAAGRLFDLNPDNHKGRK